MSVAAAPESAQRVMCQAIPIAALHGWRNDPLCASTANTTVSFAGREMPVCKMHRIAYLRALAEDPRKARALTVDVWCWQL